MLRVGIGLLLWMFLLGLSAQAQDNCAIYVRGQVKSTNGEVLSGVIVRLTKSRTTTTDQEGNFEFSKLCEGNHTLTLTHLGYREQALVLDLHNDSTLVLTLTPDAIHLQDITIIGQQQAALSQSTHGLSAQELQENKGKTLAESLLAISGVSTIGMGNSIVKPVINGLHSNRILILNNGIRQEGQQWGVEHAPEIDPFIGDRLEVIKGAQGVRYGADALGGVVLVSPNPIDTSKTLSGKIDAIGQTNGRGGTLHALLEGRTTLLPNLGWRIQSSGKKLGNYAAPRYQVGNTGVEELNYSGALTYQMGKNNFEAFYSHFGTTLGIFEGAHIGTIDDIYARIANGRPFEDYAFSYAIKAPRQKVSHDLAKATWKHFFQADRSLEVQYGFQRNHRREYDVRRVASDDTPMADMVLNTQSLDVLFKEKNSSLGVQALSQVNNNTPGTGTTPIIPNFDNYTVGLFGIHQFHIGRLHAEAGARYDFKYLDVAGFRYRRDVVNADGSIPQYLLEDTRTFHNASGTIGILYHFTPTLSWKSNIGLAWRAPSVNELYSDGVHHGSATYELGNEQLKSEKGLKWINSFILNTDKINVTLDAYAQMLYDYIYAQPNPDSVRQTIRGTFPLFVYQQHDALFYGADLRLAYLINEQLQYDVSASLVRAKNLSLKNYLPYIPADRLQHGLTWRYKSNAEALSYLKVAHRFVAKQTRYEPNSDYQAPPPAYHLIDLVASKQFDLATDRKLAILLSVDNVFNREYKDYLDRLRYYTHQMGRNINLKISYQF
ncbi:TonB-dependent receptor [Sphingobacterium oryzagri]|uniref:TonB-dependent receptor n=1 Tax=Sphingobacterium oryzagri TaxID=3025669 RepID=A0ABY7WL46_9SPHI|nr:TonB-dependent receptor [Sphingobacterium sp. KACC 22765]WDF70322.1 TonB-dependent receptor [Sphingobacterium sp. KACC 22765]